MYLFYKNPHKNIELTCHFSAAYMFVSVKDCHKESHIDSLPRRYCLEWYKLVDGETRPAEVNISWSNTLEDIKKGKDGIHVTKSS